VNVAVKLVEEYVTLPATAEPTAGVTVNVIAEIVDAVIAWLKVAVIVVFVATSAVPFAGVVVVTLGGGNGAAAVVNDQLSFAARAVPAESVAPVVMVAVYTVL
jgi:hypothetical protein